MNGQIKNKKILKVATKMILYSEKIRNDKTIRGRENVANKLIKTKYFIENGTPKIQKKFLGVKKVMFDGMQYPKELYLLDKARRLEGKLQYIESRPHSYETLINVTRVCDLVHRTKIFYQNGRTDEEFNNRSEEFMQFVEDHIVLRNGRTTFRIAGREDVRKKEKRPDGKLKTRGDYLNDNTKYYKDYKQYLNEKAAAEEEKEF